MFANIDLWRNKEINTCVPCAMLVCVCMVCVSVSPLFRRWNIMILVTLCVGEKNSGKHMLMAQILYAYVQLILLQRRVILWQYYQNTSSHCLRMYIYFFRHTPSEWKRSRRRTRMGNDAKQWKRNSVHLYFIQRKELKQQFYVWYKNFLYASFQ